jgi:hypothetical protein
MGKLFGLGLVGLLGGTAFGQTAPQAAYLRHPLGVRPDHGAYMVCVKAYTGPQSQALAESLADHIRTTHKAAAYLFEYGGEARAAEEAKQARAREIQRKESEPFLLQQAEEKKKAEAAGRRFVEQPVKVLVPKMTVPVQWAVLVGGFPTEEAARQALDVVRKWPPPADKFMDVQFVDGGATATHINPFATATVFPNPAVRKQAGPVTADPALVQMNSEEPLSLLNTRKKYTLLVKAFTARTVTKSKDEDKPGIWDALFGKGDEAAKQLQANAFDARKLAEALRTPEWRAAAQADAAKVAAAHGLPAYQVPPLTAYVLHTRTGSLVCVGEFDSEDDPELVAAGRVLQYMSFEVKFPDGRTERRRMFDNVIPLPVPRP